MVIHMRTKFHLLAVLEWTSGKLTISGQLLRMYGQSSSWTTRMSGRKRHRAVTTDEMPFTCVPPAKRGINKRTADTWLAEYDKELNTSVWLRYELADRDHVVEHCPCVLPLASWSKGLKLFVVVQSSWKQCHTHCIPSFISMSANISKFEGWSA